MARLGLERVLELGRVLKVVVLVSEPLLLSLTMTDFY
jgi:hypothetical protein